LEFNSLFKKIFYNWHVKILSISAAVFLFVFNRMVNLEENVLTVPLEIRLHDGFSRATELVRNSVNVTIRGDKELEIRKITGDDIDVYADLSLFTKEDTYTAKLQYEKKGIAASLSPVSITLDPADITISIERTEQKSAKIEAVIKTTPPDGYDYSYSLFPQNVLIAGPRSLVETIQSIKTEGIDLSGKTENFSLPVKLVSPNDLIILKDATKTEFQCIINMVIVEKIIEVRIKPVDLNAGLRIDSRLPPFGNLDIKASPDFLDSFQQDSVSLALDCSNIKSAGRYVIRTKPIIPEGVVVVRYSPEELIVDVGGF
jgi:YbbR domain-containing protein